MNPHLVNKNFAAELTRKGSPFAQNVRNMNFFSIFVNNSVDEQMEN